MLAPYMKIPTQKTQHLSNDEESIINSFYEERKARSNNHKYHNLLKKNISFFHPENNREDSRTLKTFGRQPNDLQASISQVRKMGQPPLPFFNAHTAVNTEVPQKQYRAKSQCQSRIALPPEDIMKTTQANSTKNADERYKQNFTRQLNKRININQYLKKWDQEEKENCQRSLNIQPQDAFEGKNRQRNNQSGRGIRKLEASLSNKINKIDKSFRSQTNSSALDQYSRISHQISRGSFEQTDNIPIYDKSQADLKEDKLYEVSNINSETNNSQNIKHTFGSAHSSRRKSQASQESPLSSHPNRQQQLKKMNNCLTSQQASQLHQNSYPLREERQKNESKPLPFSYRLKYNYIDPQQEANYKRRIQDLEIELSELKAKHKKEEKFIQSVVKMRRVMIGCDEEECSLKQLWRWIKQLPRK